MHLSSLCHELKSRNRTGFVLAGVFLRTPACCRSGSSSVYHTDGPVPRLSVIKGVVFVLQAPENNPNSVLTQRGPGTLV